MEADPAIRKKLSDGRFQPHVITYVTSTDLGSQKTTCETTVEHRARGSCCLHGRLLARRCATSANQEKTVGTHGTTSWPDPRSPLPPSTPHVAEGKDPRPWRQGLGSHAARGEKRGRLRATSVTDSGSSSGSRAEPPMISLSACPRGHECRHPDHGPPHGG